MFQKIFISKVLESYYKFNFVIKRFPDSANERQMCFVLKQNQEYGYKSIFIKQIFFFSDPKNCKPSPYLQCKTMKKKDWRLALVAKITENGFRSKEMLGNIFDHNAQLAGKTKKNYNDIVIALWDGQCTFFG